MFSMNRFPQLALIVFCCLATLVRAGEPMGDDVVIPHLSGSTRKAPVQVGFVGNEGQVAVFELAGNYDRDEAGSFNLEPRTAVANAFYSQHADVFDFLVVFTTFEFQTGDARAFYVSVFNDTQGIGQDPLNLRSAFGQSGKLQGFIDMAALTRYELDSLQVGYDSTLDTLLHETMHRWGVRARFRDGANPSDELLGFEKAHWSQFVSSDASVMGGGRWRTNDDGTFTATEVRYGFNPMDLYLAGFLPPEQVPSFFFLREAAGDRNAYWPNVGDRTAATAVEVQVGQVIDALGPRIPAYAAAQRDFRAGFILLKQPGEEVPDRVFADLNDLARAYATRFSVLTRGLGIMRTQLVEEPTEHVGLPDTVQGGPALGGRADLSKGAAWLLANQQPGGFWQDKPLTRVLDTVHALRALEQLNLTDPAMDRARTWLRQHTPQNNDERAWLTGSGALSGAAMALVRELEANQGADGGWGLDAQLGSSTYDTALVLEQLQQSGLAQAATLNKAAAYLLAHRQAAWGPVQDGAPSIDATARTVAALVARGTSQTDLGPSLSWLFARQNGDGSFGQGAGTSHETALVMRTLSPLAGTSAVVDAAANALESRQTADGSWEGSVYATAQALLALRGRQNPNLTIMPTMSLSPNAPNDGEVVTVTFRVQNTGLLTTPASVARLYLGDPQQGGVALPGDILIPALEPGVNLERTGYWDTLGHAGAQTLVVWVDPLQTLAENNEQDNQTQITTTVGPASNAVDLDLLDHRLVFEPGVIASLPTALHVAIPLRNRATAAIAEAALSLQWSVDQGPWTELTRQNLALDARSTLDVQLDTQLTRAGRVRLRLVADPEGLISESDETNNTVTFEMGQQPSLDLTVLPSDLSLTTNPATSGEDVGFTALIRNLGTQPSPPVKLQAWIHGPAGEEQILDQTAQLAAGEVATRELLWRAGTPGQHALRVTVDEQNAAAEGNETNNSATLDFEVASSALPNLVVDHEDLVFDPKPGLEGAPLTVTLPIYNVASTASGPFQVDLYRGVPSNGGVLLASQSFDQGIAGEASAMMAITTPALEGGGEQLFYVQVDPENTVVEHSEDDNSAFEVLSVLRLPDLTVSPGNVTLHPGEPVIGEAISAEITVDNLSQQPAQQVAVSLYEVLGDDSLIAVGSARIDTINPNGSAVTTLNWTFGASGEPSRLRLVVDETLEIPETDESNNTAEIPTVVQDRQFFATQRYISPNGDQVQDQTELAFAVDTPGDLRIEIRDLYDRLVRAYDDGPLRDQARGSVTWDGRDDRGVLVRDGDFRVRLSGPEETVLGQLIVSVDTNRTPIHLAVDTPRAYFTDLRCSVNQAYGTKFSGDGKYLYANGIIDIQGETQKGLFRIPTRGKGLDTLVSKDWLDTVPVQAGVGNRISRYFPLADGQIVFATSFYDCTNCDQGLWLKRTPAAAPVRLHVAGATQFTTLGVEDNYVYTDGLDAPRSIVKVSLDPTVHGTPLQGPTPYGWFREPVRGGYLAGTSEYGTFNGESTYVQKLWFVSADPTVAPEFLGQGPALDYEVSQDHSQVLVFGHTEFYDYDGGGEFKEATGSAKTPKAAVTKAGGQFGELSTWDLSSGAAVSTYTTGFALPDKWNFKATWSPDNRLLVLDGPAAEVRLLDRHGVVQRAYAMPTGLFQEYLNTVDHLEYRYGFESWRDWPEFGEKERPVRWDDKGQSFALGFTLYVKQYREIPQKNQIAASTVPQAAKAKATNEVEAFNGVHIAQLFRFDLESEGETLLGTINLTRNPDIIFPGQLEWGYLNRLTWMAGTDTLLLQGDGLATLDMLPEVALKPLNLGDPSQFWPGRPGALSKKLLVYGGPMPEPTCPDGEPIRVFESADNLLTHLELGQQGLVLELKGAAADRHLANHQLDWAYANAPNTWYTLTSASTVPVIDDVFDTWVPPEPGAYLVRLTVRDRAGNIDQATRTVNWYDQASLANVKVEPRFISPNGDGIQDAAVISFRVLEPLHLDVTVEDKTGHVVRTLPGDYPVVTGATETLTWNGRNQAGNLVADGPYLVRVQNRRFKVVVDNTPPELDLFKQEAYTQNEFTGKVDDRYRLSYTIEEDNLHEALIEFQVAEGNRFEFYQIQGGTESEYTAALELTQASYIEDRYHISASDLAGNRATYEAEPAPQSLIFKAIRQVQRVEEELEIDRLGLPFQEMPFEANLPDAIAIVPHSQRMALELVSALPLPPGNFFIELAEPSQPLNWARIPVTPLAAQEPEHGTSETTAYEHLFPLPFASLTSDQMYIRIRVETAGGSVTSNWANIIVEPALRIAEVAIDLPQAAAGLLEPYEDNELLLDLVEQVPYQDGTKTQIWVRESLFGNPTSPRLVVTSADDARYAIPTAFVPKGIAVMDEPSPFSGYLFEVATLPCNTYQLQFTAKFPRADGTVVDINTADPVTGEMLTLERSCIKLEHVIEPVMGPLCKSQPSGKIKLTVDLSVDRGEVPTNLEVYSEINGERVLVANKPSPQIGKHHFLIDTTALPEGLHTLSIEAVDTVGERTVAVSSLPVDRTPAEISFDYPANGDVLCAELMADGRIALPLEGVVRDANPVVYEVSIGNGFDAPVLHRLKKMEPLKLQGTATHFGELDRYLDPDMKGNPGWLRTGEITARIEAQDWSGASTCVEVRFFLDVSAEGTVARNFGLFSPNNDDAFDSVEVDVVAYEQLSTTVELFQAVEGANGKYATTGSALSTLLENHLIAGEWSFPWAGIDANGQVVPDGLYGLRFTFTDACGLTRVQESFGEVDTTKPDLAIDYPGTGDPLGAIVEVLGHFDDLHFQSAEIAFAEAGSTPLWSRLGRHRRPVPNTNRIATWPTVGLNGEYLLRLVARDTVANEAEIVVPLTLSQPTALVWALNASPYLFSPNNDGALDTTEVGIGLNAPAVITATVRNEADQILATLTASQALPVGTHFFTWDGKASNGAVLPDGAYRLHVHAEDSPATGFTQNEEIRVVLDTLAPQLTVLHPNKPVVKGLGAFVLNFEDLHPNDCRLAFQSEDGEPVYVIETEQNGRHSGGDLSTLAEGSYVVTAQARDLAGNVTLVEQNMVIDNTPPEAELLTPLEDALLGGLEPLASITGVARDSHFGTYTLSTRAPGGEWIDLLTSATAPTGESLGSWRVVAPDGAYSLRLKVADLAGWETEVVRAVKVDTTAPVAQITAPASGAVLAKDALFLGTATDQNLRDYRLQVSALGGTPAWSDVFVGETNVSAGTLMEWTQMPPDGIYLLRLLVTDKVGLTASQQIQVSLDTEPPQPPIALEHEVQPNWDVRLTWTASPSSDVVNYRVFRNGAALGETPTTNWTDPDVSSGEQRYHVVALDRVGNLSAPSNERLAIIDRMPPEVALLAPLADSRVRGQVPVVGTATSPDDFFTYRLSVRLAGDPEPGDVIRQSGVPAVNEQLSLWDSTQVSEEAWVILRLEGEDTRGNIGVVERRILVDNQAPAAPTGLRAVLQSPNVATSWNPNSETDLAGYLIYIDGQLANASGQVGDDLRPFIIPVTSYLDLQLPDGNHTYVVHAIDQAGNVSGPSNPASVTMETGPPDVVFVEPADQTRFEASLFALVRSEDTDIAEVLFEYAPAGSGQWVALGAPDTILPYEAILDPPALNLTYGAFDLRATAKDDGGLVDPTPAQVTVHYTDLEAPAPVVDLATRVDSHTVHLTWTASNAPDFASYRIYRLDQNYQPVELATVSTPEYQDVDRELGYHYYEVRVVDQYDNASDPSNRIPAWVFQPTVVVPSSPSLETQISLTGFTPVGGTMEGTIEDLQGSRQFGPFANIDGGSYTLPSVALALGPNQFTFQLQDAAGNRSVPVELNVIGGRRPNPPQHPAVSVQGLETRLTWEAPELEAGALAELEPVGYRVFRNGEPVHADSSPALTFNASSRSWDVYRLQDNNIYTYWYPTDTDLIYGKPWLEASFDQMLVTKVSLGFYWGDSPTVLTLEGWDGSGWVQLTRVDSVPYQLEVNLPAPFYTNRIRMVVQGYNAGRWIPVRVAEMGIQGRPLQTEPPFIETLTDGNYPYTVTAVNGFGFESDPSEPVIAAVGDVVAPDPVVLSGDVVGVDALLSWEASTASDLGGYQLFRDGQSVYQEGPGGSRTFNDSNLANGTYTYQVFVYDQIGNLSAASNSVALTVNGELPAPPNLQVVPDPDHRELLLTWSGPGSGGTRLERALAAQGPFTELFFANDPSVMSYPDADVIVDTTYYYRAIALDSRGNESDPSAVVSGRLTDTVAPEAPVILYPTQAGTVFVTEAERSDIGGSAEPGTSVEIRRNGTLVGTVPSGEELVIDNLYNSDLRDDVRLSPDGHLALVQGYPSLLVDLEAGTSRALPFDNATMFWDRDGLSFFAFHWSFNGELRRYNLEGVALDTELQWQEIYQASLSRDGRKLLVGGYRYLAAENQHRNGVWIIDRDGGTELEIPGIEGWNLHESLVSWSPNGAYVAFGYYQGENKVGVFELETQNLQSFGPEPSGRQLVWDATSRYLHFSSWANRSIHRADVQTGELLEFANGQVENLIGFSPDGRHFAYATDWSTLVVLEEDLVTEWGRYPSDGSLENATWRANGMILAQGWTRLQRILLPGTFLLTGMPLEVGDQTVTATARDASGNRSRQSDPIQIRVPGTGLPDLALLQGDLSVLPGAALPQQPFRVNLQVRNLGQGTSPETQLVLLLTRPDGSGRQLLQEPVLPALGAGERRSFNVDLTGETALGIYRLTALVDGQAAVREVNEANNIAVAEFRIYTNEDPAIALQLDRSDFPAGHAVTGSLSVFNPGPDFHGRVVVAVLDSLGAAIGTALDAPVRGLGNGAATSFPLSWDTEGVFAGAYQLEARLLDTLDAAVDQTTVPFNLGAQAELALSLNLPRSRYQPSEAIEPELTVDYLYGNTVLNDAQVTWRVFDPNEVLIRETTTALPSMLPEAVLRQTQTWDLSDQEPGDYQLTATLDHATGTSEARLLVTLEVPDPVRTLSGNLNLTSRSVAIGSPLAVPYQVRNDSRTALDNVPVRVELRRAGNFSLLASQSSTMSLNGGASQNESVSFSTQNLGFESYLLVLLADLSAHGGAADTLLDTSSVSGIDAGLPQIQAQHPLNGAVVGANVSARATARDQLSPIAHVQLALDGGPEQPMGQSSTPNLYRRELTQLAEGPHQVVFAATDTWSNRAITPPIRFTVDTTAPQIQVSGVVDGARGNTPVTPVITVNDLHPGTTTVLLNGVPFVSGTPVTVEGLYVLTVSAVDQAGNNASSRHAFELDLSAPVVQLSYPEANAVLLTNTTVVTGSTEAGARVLLSQGGFNAETVSAGDGSFAFADVPLALGANLIQVHAVDSAGNVGATVDLPVTSEVPTAAVQGSLSLPTAAVAIGSEFGATYELRNTGNLPLNQRPVRLTLFSPEDQVAAEQNATFDLAPSATTHATQTFATASLLPGTYRVTLQAQLAANEPWLLLDSALVTLSDQTPPEVALVAPAAGAILPSPLEIQATASDALSAPVTVTALVGGLEVPMALVDGNQGRFLALSALPDGETNLRLRALDGAGNEATTTTVTVTIDSTPPLIEIQGVADNTRYGQPVRPVITVTEPHLDGGYAASIDGMPFTSGDLVQDHGTHQLEVVAVDLAGNRSVRALSFELDLEAPTVTVTYPEADARLATTQTEVRGSSEPGALVQLERAGVQYQAQADGDGLFVFPAVVLEVGANTLSLFATDRVGNQGPTVTHSVTVALEAPVVAWIEPAAGATVEPGFTAAVNVGSRQTVVRVELRIDGQLYGTLEVQPSGSYATQVTTLAPGSHQLQVAAFDQLNNEGLSAVRTVTVNGGQLDLVVSQPLDGSTVTSLTTPVAGTTTPGATVTVSLPGYQDQQLSTDGQFRFADVPLAPGGNTLVVEASRLGQTKQVSVVVVRSCATCDGETLIVDESVTLDFSGTEPTYAGDPDLAPFFSFAKPGNRPQDWTAFLRLGERSLVVRNGAKITVRGKTFDRGTAVPGLSIEGVCGLTVEEGGSIALVGANAATGTLSIQARGLVEIAGLVTNRIEGTWGTTGDLRLGSDCGDLNVLPTGKVTLEGTQEGGRDLVLNSRNGNIHIAGLVDAFFAWGRSPNLSIVANAGSITIDGTRFIGTETTTQRPIASGVSLRALAAQKPGQLDLLARRDITIHGYGYDPRQEADSIELVLNQALRGEGNATPVNVRLQNVAPNQVAVTLSATNATIGSFYANVSDESQLPNFRATGPSLNGKWAFSANAVNGLANQPMSPPGGWDLGVAFKATDTATTTFTLEAPGLTWQQLMAPQANHLALGVLLTTNTGTVQRVGMRSPWFDKARQLGTVAIKSKAFEGGSLRVRSIDGSVIATDYALDNANKDNTRAWIDLDACGDIELGVRGQSLARLDGPRAVVNVSGTAAGGVNRLHAADGQLLVGAGVEVLAGGTPVGANQLRSCTGLILDGVVSPLDLEQNDDTGSCGPSEAALIISNPPNRAVVNQPYTTTLVSDDPSVSMYLLEGPPGMTLTGKRLSWTPNAGQVGDVDVVIATVRGCGYAEMPFLIIVTATAGKQAEVAP